MLAISLLFEIKHFKVTDINKVSIAHTSKKELINMHRRVHQLYSKTQNKKLLKQKHELLVKEMIRRKIQHSSPLE